MRVKFWPKDSGIPVTKCNHRWGAEMTFSHQTDNIYESSIYAVELYGFRNNVRLGAFANNFVGTYNSGIPSMEATGLIRHDIYFATDYWKNPDTGNLEVIPDYNSNQWTLAGAAFFDVTPGDSKSIRTPSHGQQMFNFSAGRLGYDFVNGIMGGNGLEEVIAVEEHMQNWLYGLIGRYPSSGSYRVGDNRGAFTHFGRWVSFRNSVPSPQSTGSTAPTQYGSGLGTPSVPASRTLFINYPSSWRWWDAINSGSVARVDADDYMEAQILATLSNNGWYRDFCHWHSARNNGTLPMIDEFLQLFRTTVDGHHVHTCSNGEAMEYMFLREITSRVCAVEKDGAVTILADIDDKYKASASGGYPHTLPLDRLNIPLSVEVDLSGTSLAGKTIRSSYGKVIDKGSNIYIIEVPFNHAESFQAVRLTEGVGGIHLTAIPTASVNITSGKLTVTADMPVKCVVYRVAAGGNDFDSLPLARVNEFKTVHELNVSGGYDYRVGIISEYGQCNLIE